MVGKRGFHRKARASLGMQRGIVAASEQQVHVGQVALLELDHGGEVRVLFGLTDGENPLRSVKSTTMSIRSSGSLLHSGCW